MKKNKFIPSVWTKDLEQQKIEDNVVEVSLEYRNLLTNKHQLICPNSLF